MRPSSCCKPNRPPYSKQNTALGSIKTELGTLQTDIDVLKDPSFFGSCTATPSDTSLATASAAAGTTLGTYSFNVTPTGLRSGVAGRFWRCRPAEFHG